MRVSASPPGNVGRERFDDGRDVGTQRSYGGHGTNVWQSLTTSRVAALACTLWVSTIVGEQLAWLAPHRVMVVFLVLPLLIASRSMRARLLLVVVCGLCGGAAAWHGVRLPVDGECGGVARLINDPQSIGHGVSVVVELENQRFEVVAHGSVARRLGSRLAGESVRITGHCSAVSGRGARFDRISHVVGRLRPDEVSEEFSSGSMATRASNRVRAALTRGVVSMPETQRSLFLGLVIGDDRAQPRSMILEFRRSGLSHLCAVSGQNVSYLLAAMSPLLRRRSRLVRWMITIGVIAWFAMLTRAEPSVLRAGVMAALVATNAAAGVTVNARVVLSGTVCALLVIDPLLAWSVGFALSVGATAGLAWVSAPLAKVVKVPWLGAKVKGLNAVLSSTLAAQVGTIPVSLFVFGSVPVVSVVTNPLAIGVAGAVMMFGLPVALAAAMVPLVEPLVSVMLVVPVRWVELVASAGSELGPTGVVNVAAWAVVTVMIARAWRRNRRFGSTRVGT